MSDVVGYILTLGTFVIGAYAAIRICIALLQTVYQNQSLLLAFPFF